MEIPGIPYFGENTQEIENRIKSAKISEHREYYSLYDLIQSEKSPDKVIIIQDDHGEWLTYLRDIKFNYRDREVYIPYYTYNIQRLPEINRKKYKGHLVTIEDNTVAVRFNYKLCKRVLNIADNIVQVYDFSIQEKYLVSFKYWYSDSTFNMDELYNCYIQYCGMFEDYQLFKHVEGYHYITKRIKGIVNHENELRVKYELNSYHPDSGKDVELNYRDVRTLGKAEYEAKIGFRMDNSPMWERQLNFESLLFCVLRGHIGPDDIQIKKEYSELGKTRPIFKYGNTIKLIFKYYWLDEYNSKFNREYSWSRV